ncbi:MAG TPA: cytochrome C oxidase subunit IV family protein [Candidatus Deferrimicrobiaceae bacterium]|nr:cytochrome C oxidase subunit IV family protein [Candidatus Deferrimicrobiaceae bacterium]
MQGHDSGNRTYLIVGGALIVLTAVTVAVSYVHLGLMNVVVALLLASLKASLVALFFMHLRYENGLVWGFALTPLLFLVFIIAGTLSDTLFR